MKVKLAAKNKDKTRYTYLVSSAEVPVLNALRRSILTLVPTMAVEDVEYRQNSSILYDEMLAHRIGLLPLTTDLKTYEMITKPEDAESLKCTVKFSLKAKGPKTVYAKDMKSSDPAVVPVYGDMPLVKLAKNQELAFEATAILGTGKEHMKWSPGLVFYKHKPEVTIKSGVDIEEAKKRIPENSALKISGNKITVDEDKLYTTNFVDSFMGEEIVDGISVNMKEDEFVFSIESFGQLAAKEMVHEGIEILKNKLNTLNELVTKA